MFCTTRIKTEINVKLLFTTPRAHAFNPLWFRCGFGISKRTSGSPLFVYWLLIDLQTSFAILDLASCRSLSGAFEDAWPYFWGSASFILLANIKKKSVVLSLYLYILVQTASLNKNYLLGILLFIIYFHYNTSRYCNSNLDKSRGIITQKIGYLYIDTNNIRPIFQCRNCSYSSSVQWHTPEPLLRGSE